MIDMQRMTRRDEGHIELLGYERRIDAIGDLIEKVCEYEDEDEKRKQGCDECEPCCRDCRNRTLECRPEEIRPLVCKDYEPSRNYCPMCGRKLVRNETDIV